MRVHVHLVPIAFKDACTCMHKNILFTWNCFTGVRTFCPRPVAKMLENIGGASALLGLVAMATDVEELYAAVKALVCVVKSNKPILKDMERISGYQVCITVRND